MIVIVFLSKTNKTHELERKNTKIYQTHQKNVKTSKIPRRSGEVAGK
jgi:hypothetical protein